MKETDFFVQALVYILQVRAMLIMYCTKEYSILINLPTVKETVSLKFKWDIFPTESLKLLNGTNTSEAQY
jgi:hypothetical protein